MVSFDSQNNSNLKCIYVDDKDATYLSDWSIDLASTFVETEVECDALDIDNDIKENCYVVYPNPTKGILYFDLPDTKIQKLTISDITGKQILQETEIDKKETMLPAHDLSDFKSGVYIISIQTKNGIFTSKIIKR
jgi:hypothetical protein